MPNLAGVPDAGEIVAFARSPLVSLRIDGAAICVADASRAGVIEQPAPPHNVEHVARVASGIAMHE
jgi:hypothetical protein